LRATASWRSMLPLSAPRMRCMPCFLPQRTCVGATSEWPLTRAFSAVLAHHRRWAVESQAPKPRLQPPRQAPKDDRELTIAVTHPGSYASHAVCITCRAPHGLGVVHLAWEWPHLCCRLLYRPPFALVIGPALFSYNTPLLRHTCASAPEDRLLPPSCVRPRARASSRNPPGPDAPALGPHRWPASSTAPPPPCISAQLIACAPTDGHRCGATHGWLPGVLPPSVPTFRHV